MLLTSWAAMVSWRATFGGYGTNMKLLGRWSLASFMKLVIDVSYYFLLVVLSVAFAIVLWLALTSGNHGSIEFEMPVRFQLDSATHHIVTSGPDIQSASITKAHGTLQVTSPVSSMGWAGLSYGIISLGVVLFVLNRLRAIFRTLRDQNPFVALNASRIRMIGILLVLGELASKGLGAWYAERIAREISVAGLTLNADFSINSWVIFSGLILLMLAEVFRLGADMKGDLETARKIQLDLVPGEIFLRNDVVVHARMRPAKIVGGDLYDVLELDEKRLAVIVGDVTGKGLPAAMLMASVLGSVRALSTAGLRGGELIAALNRHVCTSNASGDRLVTLFYGELDTTTGAMTYVNAGHNPPILLRSDGRVDRLQPTTMVLGAMGDAVVEARQVGIKPADRLLLFTDGFSEAFNKRDEEYGEERLTESFVRVHTLPPAIVVERLIADVLSFCGSVQPRDDMTLMLVETQPI
jgi:serine phosphatase RsbU (regulator of sigma subunit)